MMKTTGIGLISVFLLINTTAGSAQPYHLSAASEKPHIVGEALLLAAGFWAYASVDPVTPDELSTLAASRLPSWDRPATERWSPELSHRSDYLLLTAALLPALFLAGERSSSDWRTIGALYAETMSLTIGLNYLTKALTRRYRPYCYNPAVPREEKLSRDARRSFYSGHAAIAFTSAAFVSTVFADYYPDSRWRPLFWAGTLALAAEVGYLRYAAGKHFVTDVVAGAVAGMLVGHFVPRWHRSVNGARVFLLPSKNSRTPLVRLSFSF